ncbi:MAG: DUF4221 family protein [Bacteroidota bacterium]
MSKIFNISILAFFIGLSSCTERGEVENNFSLAAPETHSLKPTGTYSLILDSSTTPLVRSLNISEENGAEKIVFLNHFTKHIYYYNLNTGKILRIINLQLAASKGLTNPIAIYARSSDSIFVQDNNNHLFLTDASGDVKKKYDISPFQDSLRITLRTAEASFPMEIFTGNIPFLIDGSLYLTGVMDESFKTVSIDQTKLLIRLDLNTARTSYTFNYPKSYSKTLWTIYFRMPSKTYNENKMIFVFSLPNDPFVYSLSINNSITEKKYAGSKLFGNIKAFPPNKDNSNDYTQKNEYFFSSPNYSTILYDKFRKVYYRFAYTPNKLKTPQKNLSIIILDNNLKRLGEYELKETKKYNPMLSFVSKEGLNIAKKDQNEDILQFQTFKPFKL